MTEIVKDQIIMQGILLSDIIKVSTFEYEKTIQMTICNMT